MESPPKRMTRARAAAKAGNSTAATAAKPSKSVAGAAIARTTGAATASTKSTAAKRKTRADDNDNEKEGKQQQQHQQQHQQQEARRALRARPKRRTDTQGHDEVVSRSMRARAETTMASMAANGTDKEVSEERPASSAARTRARPRKASAAEAKETAPEATRKTTRSRTAAAAVTSASTTAGGAKSVVKKTVKFQEPDKENMEPRPKGREPVATGLRGRPVRRGGAVSTAATRPASLKTATASRGVAKKPLSPKKVTQMPVSRDDDSSEDELAEGGRDTGTTMEAMVKTPVRRAKDTVDGKTKQVEPLADENMMAIKTSPATDTGPERYSSLGSPAKRPPASPHKDSLKSPAKRMGLVSLPGSAVKTEHAAHADGSTASLLQSAAKRPQMPNRGQEALAASSAHSPLKTTSAIKCSLFQSPAKRAMPGFRSLTEPRPRAMASLGDAPPGVPPLALVTPSRMTVGRSWSSLLVDEPGREARCDDELFSTTETEMPAFSGRLSALLPRHVDPALRVQPMVPPEAHQAVQLVGDSAKTAGEVGVAAIETPKKATSAVSGRQAIETGRDCDGDIMDLDDGIAAEDEQSAKVQRQARQQQQPKEQRASLMFQLRLKDTNPCHGFDWDSDSEDDMVPHPLAQVATSPTKTTASRRSTIGLNSLADQFGSWATATPAKPNQAEEGADAARSAGVTVEAGGDPFRVEDAAFKGNYFEDEMQIHNDAALGAQDVADDAAAEREAMRDGLLDDMVATNEDIALAKEADTMSMLEPQALEAVVGAGQSFDDGLSEASQEYGDENAMPGKGDAPESRQAKAPMTPARAQKQMRTFFTTTKVPLKPVDESTPSPLKKRSWSASRVSGRRRGGASSMDATGRPHSPCKSNSNGDKGGLGLGWGEEAAPRAPVTPLRQDKTWSTTGTPARTPRQDVDPGLLQGAVVFVDVYTVEGADASGIFFELLNQMGARCIKTWHWNPATRAEGEASSAKAGITHVVYKDGGRRTLEKVQWTNGAVRCVGVGWVLDCEWENEWLDEAAYSIDTSVAPRGGARRRKSMEPKALTKVNGSVVGSPAREAPDWTPHTLTSRRESTLWMHTPSDQEAHKRPGGSGGEDGDEDLEWSCVLLTPVPKTPAPEAVARYAAELPATPAGEEGDDGDDGDDGDGPGSSPIHQTLMMRTCPSKRSQLRGTGEGILGRDGDESVPMRLMAARRKSLQFAPKIGSPLAKTWG